MSTRALNVLLAVGALALILLVIAGCDRPAAEVYRDQKRCIDAGMLSEHDKLSGEVICVLPRETKT